MKKYLPLLAAVLLGLAVCPWLVGCSQPSATDEAAPAEQAPAASAFPRAAEGEFSVMTFNLNQYALVSRDGDPDTLEPKPREEAAAIIEAFVRQPRMCLRFRKWAIRRMGRIQVQPAERRVGLRTRRISPAGKTRAEHCRAFALPHR